MLVLHPLGETHEIDQIVEFGVVVDLDDWLALSSLEDHDLHQVCFEVVMNDDCIVLHLE